MSIKFKTRLISLISVAFTIIFAFEIFNFVIFKYIDRIEIRDSNNNFETVNYIYNNEEKKLEETSMDWSNWNDTYDFIAGKNRDSYIENNLDDGTLKNLNLNFMFFTDKHGNIIYSSTNNIENETKNLLIYNLINKSNTFNRITSFKNNNKINSGIVNISGHLFILSISPITSDDNNLKSNGTLIIGKSIDKSLINYINSITKCKVTFTGISDSNKINTTSIQKTNYLITASKQLNDITGSKSVLISIAMPRNDYNLSKFYFAALILIFLVTLIIVCLIFTFTFNKCILNRLKIINEFINKISRTKDTNCHLNISGNDEISNIANSINNMLYRLNSAYKNILKLSYHDNLTNLNNRAYMEKLFNQLTINSNDDYSIIMGDVNGLKLVNDTFGHTEGDKLIRSIGMILKKACSNDDIIARWGGDEFIILIINKHYAYLSTLMQNIKNECEKINNFSFKISIALGAAQISKRTSLELVMNLAEERMYRSKLTEKKSSRNATIASLEKTLYEKNSETEKHTFRVKELSIKLGKKLNLSQDKLEELELLSLLHDIGKIGIPDKILMKPGKLTSEEWDIMEKHTEIGYRIAKATPGLTHVANEILCHHEKFNGTGYPQGLKGEEIPILSRIINIVDSFDVMTHKRVYKEASSIDYALEELERYSGTQFDPNMVNKFIDLLKETIVK